MTVDTIGTNSPTVFDAGLPPIAYEHAHDPEEAHRLIRQARQQGPIALGPHGPEVLSYELVRTVLRDPRFRMPQGSRACGTRHHQRPGLGQGHHRPVESGRCRSQSAAPTRLQGVHTTVDRTTDAPRSSRSSPNWSTR